MSNRINLVVMASVLICTSFYQTVFSCLTPMGEVPFCYIYQNTEVIFVGKILKAEPFDYEPTNSNEAKLKEAYKNWMGVYEKMTFAVVDKYKGVPSESVEILNLTKGGTSCDNPIKMNVGERWAVLAHRLKPDSTDYYVTTAKKIDENSINDLVIKLEKVREKGITPSIFGQIHANYPLSKTGLKGYQVTAQRDGNTFRAKMDQYGQFSFDNIESGTYNVRAYVPFAGYVALPINQYRHDQLGFDEKKRLFFYEYKANVEDNKCFYETFWIRPNAAPQN